MVRTRFAPSPTGSLHVGNARIAVLNWLFSRQNDGVFVLRVEDTDTERNVPGAEAELESDLRWLGLDWDEGPGAGASWNGPVGPYRQSERLEFYREFAEWMIAAGVAYRCWCTPEELEQRRQEALAAGRSPHYDGTCRTLPPERAEAHRRAGRSPAVRFEVPAGPAVVVRDLVRGSVRVEREEIGDFVILRADGRPTYNFAVVVDDALMEITHVIRGSAHLSNTPRQVLLYEALGHDVPLFAHVPMVLGADRQKLSKRHGARALAEYRREGYHPDALLNYLSLLSWSSPSGDEVLSRERLIEEISLERIRAADAVFDPQKLRWLSARHIEAMPIDALVRAVQPFLDRSRFPLADEDLAVAVAAVRTHLSTFSEINEQLEPFLGWSDDGARAARAALRDDEEARRVLCAVAAQLRGLSAWTPAEIDGAIREAGRSTGTRGRPLFLPIRRAVSGEEHGPPLGALLAVLGRQRSLRLLEEAGAA